MADTSFTEKPSGAFNLCQQEGRNIFNNTWNQETKPVEMYRTDLISAMKIPDHQVLTNDFIKITDPWKQEYDKGVQVPVDIEKVPMPHFDNIKRCPIKGHPIWSLPQEYHMWQPNKCILDQIIDGIIPKPVYDMDEDDFSFLNSMNSIKDLNEKISEVEFETIFTYLDSLCHINMVKRYQKDLTYSIQFDDSVFCEVCKDIYSEPDNEMIFCDSCNICVHQSCFGISTIPQGDWLCSPCKANCLTPVCLLCMQGGGAFKSTLQGEWVHIFCALWIPEVGFGNVEKMAPITRIKQIPASRWSLTCCFCQERVGTCIQCSEKTCFVSFHPTCAYVNQCHMMTSFGTIESELDIVRNFTYCLKHTPLKVEEPLARQNITLPLYRKKDVHPLYNNQVKITRSIQKEFYNFINILEITSVLNINEGIIKFTYDYWKEKRKLNGNNPLIDLPPLGDLVEKSFDNSMDNNEQNEIDPFLKLVSLRQDLERARVLCHMTLQREKLKKKVNTSLLQVIEVCFHRNMQLPLNLQILGTHLPSDQECPSTSDEDSSFDISQPSISNIFCSPVNQIQNNIFDFTDEIPQSDLINSSKNEDMVVAHEVVLKEQKSEYHSENNNSDSLSYNYRSSEDPEWQGGSIKERKRKKKKNRVQDSQIDEFKGNALHYSQKITIELSDKSDIPSSIDEACNFSTPPNSPEFKTPEHSLLARSSKRKNCSDSSCNSDTCLNDMHTPPSPKDLNKENVDTKPKSNDHSTPCQNVSSTTLSNPRRSSKRHKPNQKYKVFDNT